MAARNREKADLLYAAVDRAAGVYRCPVEPAPALADERRLPPRDEALEERFVRGRRRGMAGIKGHRSVGGIRVSMYNAVSQGDVRAPRPSWTTFARRHG